MDTNASFVVSDFLIAVVCITIPAMSRLRSIFSASEQTLAQPDHGNITPSRNYESEKVGSGKECLFSELEKLYWLGAKAELDNIVTTLRIWKQSATRSRRRGEMARQRFRAPQKASSSSSIRSASGRESMLESGS